jgi:O-antigen/teichoic acid export membrane protein
LGVADLGIYQMAYKISNLSFTEITDVTSRVTFPVYSKIAGNKTKLRRAYLRVLLMIIFPSLIISILLILFPVQLIKFFLGIQWMKAAQPLRILAIFGLIRALGSSAAPLFLAVGKPKLTSLITFIKFIILVILLLWWRRQWGLMGVSLAVLFSALFIQPLVWFNVIKIFRNQR